MFTFIGSHTVEIEYGGEPVPGSPFVVKSYDVSKVLVQGIRDGIAGKTSKFIGKLLIYY